ncbi:MAG TPA: 3-hydroxybutyrate dehydrogenase, partial [Hyphomonas sp.]|nr:3-hydroxybutyrate dehydrogenase [Hyphomonas sp.]
MLKGKSALITGSTSGIGKAIATRLAAEGANVMLNGFGDAKEIEALRSSLERDHKVTAAFSGADLTRPDAIELMIAEAAGMFGGIDILVNNAGLTRDNLFMVMKDEQWDDVIAVNLTSTFMLMRAGARHMMRSKTGYGRIIN